MHQQLLPMIFFNNLNEVDENIPFHSWFYLRFYLMKDCKMLLKLYKFTLCIRLFFFNVDNIIFFSLSDQNKHLLCVQSKC